jgi:aryl-alcohol dehydrogenase-like predicted oxidoreductase
LLLLFRESTKLIQRPFGTHGFNVSALGLGAGQIGDAALSEDHAGTLLNRAVDRGVTLIDTARGYGLSEARIGRHLSYRRNDFILATKVGYGIPGFADWTYDCIIAGVEEALKQMRTDRIDIVHLHSCPLEILQRGDVINALHKCRDAGKIRVAAYSGENAELEWAIESGEFGSVECSVNLFDQASLARALPRATLRGMGVIAKRPVANAPWRFAERPIGDYCEQYWLRMQKMQLDPQDLPWQDFALRFTAFAPNVSSAIVGTSSIENLVYNIDCIGDGSLPEAQVRIIRETFLKHGDQWDGQV